MHSEYDVLRERTLHYLQAARCYQYLNVLEVIKETLHVKYQLTPLQINGVTLRAAIKLLHLFLPGSVSDKCKRCGVVLTPPPVTTSALQSYHTNDIVEYKTRPQHVQLRLKVLPQHSPGLFFFSRRRNVGNPQFLITFRLKLISSTTGLKTSTFLFLIGSVSFTPRYPISN